MEFNQWLICFFMINLALYCPGPMSLFLMNHGVNYGYRKTVFCVIGAAAAYFIQMLVVAVGFSLFFKKFPFIFFSIKTIGAMYFIYLGSKQILKKSHMLLSHSPKLIKNINSSKLFFQGLVVGLLNPKSILLFAALFSQFVTDTQVAVEQNAVLMGTFLVSQFISSSLYAVVGGQFFYSLKNNSMRWFKAILGLFLIFFGFLIFLTKFPS